MMRHLRYILAGGLLFAAPVLPASAEEPGAMALALAAADAQDWVTARDAAAESGPMAEALVGWQALRAGFGEFGDYLAFIRNHPDWPGLSQLRSEGDKKLTPDLPAEDIREWFGERLPDSLKAETAYLTALDSDEAQAEITRFWTTTPLDMPADSPVLERYDGDIAQLHRDRVRQMLDMGEWRIAEGLLSSLHESDRPLPAARIALQAGRPGVDDLILALPETQRDDPGLTMDRFLWRVRAKQHEGARQLMLQASTSAEALRDPEKWAQMRVDYARLAMRNDDWSLALRLATPHFLPAENRHYSDLEWLAGYAALKSGQPDTALEHFRHLETVVDGAISTSRAYYWQARAYEALGDASAADQAYAGGAAFPGTYYGQLSAEKTGAQMPTEYSIAGAGIESLPDWRGDDLRENPVFHAGMWLLATGHPDEAQRFFRHLAETASPEDIARMSRLMYEAGRPWHGLRLSKYAASQGIIYPAAHFPLTGLEKYELELPPELALSIARQESEFNHTAGSHAGALGLMQLLPGTAQDMARRTGLPYERARLTTDPVYNAKLGAAYLRGLRDRFGNSSALIASGYNAGPGRPIKWLQDFGDLRREADPVDWVELIPFDETRNYVMRVTEAIPIYRARIAAKPVPLVPTWELTGGGLMPPPPPRLTLALSAYPPRRPLIGPRLPEGWINPTLPVAATE